jgi:uncharacterized protein (TIGR02466 family)
MTEPTYTYRVRAAPRPFFETPVAVAKLDGADRMLDDLEDAIRARMAMDPGLKRSNHLGWHSDTRMLSWGGAAAKKLSETAIEVAKRMSHFKETAPEDMDWTVSMWANVSAAGALNQLHVHPQNLWAAVLYLDLGSGDGEDVGGALYLEDPRFPMSAMHNTAFRFAGMDGRPQDYQPNLHPQRGDLIVFPAWLRHGVRPYTGPRERISIAMNIDARRRT